MSLKVLNDIDVEKHCVTRKYFIIYKVMKYRKILMKYIVYSLFSLIKYIKFYIFTPPECTYNFLDYL